MKPFSLFIIDVNDGRTHSGLTADLDELLRTVQSTGRGGTLTLKVKVAPATKGHVSVDKITVVVDRKLELPKPESPSDFFWLTDEAEPTRQHPRQHELPLRDVTPTHHGAMGAATHAADPLTGELKEIRA